MKKYESFGFTLIELIVAIAIIGMLAAVTLASFSQGNKSKKVQLTADSLESAVRTAQDFSLNPKAVAGISCSLGSIPTGYHLKFDTNSTSVVLSVADKCGDPQLAISHFDISQGAQIKKSNGLNVDATSVGPAGGTLEIEFLPPFGKAEASLNGGAYKEFGQATVQIESTDSSVTKSVIIDGISGRVDVK